MAAGDRAHDEDRREAGDRVSLQPRDLLHQRGIPSAQVAAEGLARVERLRCRTISRLYSRRKQRAEHREGQTLVTREGYYFQLPAGVARRIGQAGIIARAEVNA